jgi:molecular chaperone IbpA
VTAAAEKNFARRLEDARAGSKSSGVEPELHTLSVQPCLDFDEVLHMTTRISLSPLFGTTVGFDRFDDLFEALSRRMDANDGYPPYDIERTGEDAYGITLSVAGFSEKDLSLTVQDDQLVVTGQRETPEDRAPAYLHRGIATRSFKRSFQLAPYVVVKGAELKDGLLRIQLVREVPEEQKPRRIDIRTKPDLRAIETAPAKAA